jgi:hypothetical protein
VPRVMPVLPRPAYSYWVTGRVPGLEEEHA